MTELHDMTATELLAAYKTRKLSPVEAVDAVITHIGKWEPKLKALYAEVVNQPVPDRLLELLQKLEAKGGDRSGDA